MTLLVLSLSHPLPISAFSFYCLSTFSSQDNQFSPLPNIPFLFYLVLGMITSFSLHLSKFLPRLLLLTQISFIYTFLSLIILSSCPCFLPPFPDLFLLLTLVTLVIVIIFLLYGKFLVKSSQVEVVRE